MNTNNKLNKANSYRLSQELLRNKALKKGVNLIAPETIFLSKDTLFGINVTVDPYVVIGPNVKIGDNSHIKSFSHLEGTKIERNVIVGPYARLREGTLLKENTKIGNFVETKKSLINKNSKVIVQGITGGEGAFHSQQMIDYGSNIVAGVTPGKGGSFVLEQNIPVFNSVEEAQSNTDANVSIIFVPPAFASEAIIEASEACLLYTSPSPRDEGESRMPASA